MENDLPLPIREAYRTDRITRVKRIDGGRIIVQVVPEGWPGDFELRQEWRKVGGVWSCVDSKPMWI